MTSVGGLSMQTLHLVLKCLVQGAEGVVETVGDARLASGISLPTCGQVCAMIIEA